MKRFGLIGITLVVAGGLLVSVAAADRPETAPKIIAGNAYGKVRPRNARPVVGGGVSPQLIGHGGEVMKSASVTSVFWGGWSDSGYVGDKVTGLASFYAGLDASSYMNTNTEYSGANGQVGSGVVYSGAAFDSSATPTRKAPTTTEVLAAVARAIKNPVPNGYYPVYTDIPRGHNGYCAWHSYGSITTSSGAVVPVQFGFFFDLANDPGCDPGGDLLGHSSPLAARSPMSADMRSAKPSPILATAAGGIAPALRTRISVHGHSIRPSG